MKYLMLLALALTACSDKDVKRVPLYKTVAGGQLPYGVAKFEDEAVVCYTFFTDSISCMKK